MSHFDDVLDGMRSSATVLILWKGEIDDKICMEMGMAIYLDKPIIIVAVDNPQIPDHVRSVARDIIQVTGGVETWDKDAFFKALHP